MEFDKTTTTTKNKTWKLLQKATIDEIWSHEWGTETKCNKIYPSIASCLISPTYKRDEVPLKISLVDKDCKSDGKTHVRVINKQQTKEEKGKKNFIICVKPLDLKNGLTIQTIRQWIKINFKLGADKIIFYADNVNVDDLNVIKSNYTLIRKFTTEKFSDCSSYAESLWHKRKMEIITYNDCFYSHLYETNFVIPLDVDEVIVPKKGNNWREGFLNYFNKTGNETLNFHILKNYASFSVRNAYFFSKYPKNSIGKKKKIVIEI